MLTEYRFKEYEMSRKTDGLGLIEQLEVIQEKIRERIKAGDSFFKLTVHPTMDGVVIGLMCGPSPQTDQDPLPPVEKF